MKRSRLIPAFRNGANLGASDVIPDNLIKLCCQEFRFYEQALEANPYEKYDRIFYVVTTGYPDEQSISCDQRVIEIRQLKNKSFAWIPQHPGDRAIVFEHKRTIDQVKLTILFSGSTVNEIAENYAQQLTEVKRQCSIVHKVELYDSVNKLTLGVWSELPTLDQICLAINKERVERDRNVVQDPSIDVRVRGFIYSEMFNITFPSFNHRLLIY